jgi:tetratricopeptide (TPR) repeat protein
VSVLRFANEESLRFSITSGLVPESVLGGTAHTWRDAEGGVFVAPAKPVPADAMMKLAAAGVERLPASTDPESASTVRCWAEMLGVVRTGEIDRNIGQVLFVVPAGASFVELAGELLRLGCDRLEWRATPSSHLLRAAAPPYYSLLRAIDSFGGVRAYVPSPRGQDRVWVEVGCEHPLARFLRPERGSMLLVSSSASTQKKQHGAGKIGPSDGASTFTLVPEGDFADIYSILDLEVPGGDAAFREHEPANEPPRLAVTLRLARAATIEAPALWVIREDAVAKIERLLASLPEEIARGLLFSPCREGDRTIVVVRSRPGTRSNVEIDGEPYRSHPSIGNLFMPCDATLEPPLRRDRVRELLTPDPDDVVWLRPTEGGRFDVERTPDAAFQPLSEWVEYVIDSNAPALVPWVKSCTFDFDAFVGVDPVLTQRREEPEEPAAGTRRRTRRAEPQPAPRVARTIVTRPTLERVPERATISAAQIDTNRVAEELAVTERSFLSLDAPADDPARSDSWARMAALNAQLRRKEDAALCWARVVWELPPDGEAQVADHEARHPAKDAWLAAETAVSRVTSARTLLALEEPSRDHVRALAVMLLSEADPDLRDLAQDATLWLDRHDGHLDMRTAWLARVALSRLVGGDRLGLARARDRLLAKIHGGLSLERDVPSFMRRAGANRDAAQIELIAGKLDALLELLEKTRRKRSATEADPKLTAAYVHFIVAYGVARLGRTERAMQLRDAAVKALPKGDAIHDLLSRAYVARVGHALEGLSAETPLPSEISSSLNALAKLDRYKVDRVRQCSKVLEPHERLDPIMAFQRGEADPRGPEFAELRGAAEPSVIEKGVVEIMTKAKASAADERARLYDGVMDFFPAIAHERAIGHLDTILGNVHDVPPPRRVQLLEEALMLAGHLGEEELARRIFAALEPLVASVGPDGAAEIAPLAAGMLRTLRRFGLRDEAQRLLGALQAAAKGRAPAHLVARLHTAAALAYLGEVERARPVFEEALTALQADLPMPERLKLTRALARALGTAPIAYAMSGLEQLEKKLDVVTDSFNTNSHVCLSVLDFMESLVLGYASEDLAVDPIARRFLDEDEYLVRRRIHRDLSR